MLKRVITAMVLAVLLVMAGALAMAANGSGNPAGEASTSTITTTTEATTTQVTTTTPAPVQSKRKSELKARRWWRRHLLEYKKTALRLETLMGKPKTRFSRRLAHASLASLRRYTLHWKAVARRVLYEYRHPPYLRAWMCIHHYEGAWNDPNAPYWGGLQMDYTFQSVYGGWLLRHKGTADHWTPMEQIWVALRAFNKRGFEPWAGTAHACGLY